MNRRPVYTIHDGKCLPGMFQWIMEFYLSSPTWNAYKEESHIKKVLEVLRVDGISPMIVNARYTGSGRSFPLNGVYITNLDIIGININYIVNTARRWEGVTHKRIGHSLSYMVSSDMDEYTVMQICYTLLHESWHMKYASVLNVANPDSIAGLEEMKVEQQAMLDLAEMFPDWKDKIHIMHTPLPVPVWQILYKEHPVFEMYKNGISVRSRK